MFNTNIDIDANAKTIADIADILDNLLTERSEQDATLSSAFGSVASEFAIEEENAAKTKSWGKYDETETRNPFPLYSVKSIDKINSFLASIDDLV